MCQNQRIKYLLGIDGGGTKTQFLLTDIKQNEICSSVLGASNPVNVGIDGTKAVLKQGIEQVCRGIDLRKISVFAGIAGGISSGNKENINEFLSGFGFGAYDNGSDVDSTLEIALKGENGVAVITGTGIVGFAQAEGVRRRIGGWGYMIDKGGSGFNYGADALNSALRYIDGRGGSKLILKLIEERLQKPLTDSIADIYAGGAAYVASFAPIVFEAFKSGDSEAENIIDRNTKELADIIRTGYDFLNSTDKKGVICGGLCKQYEILTPFLLKQLGSEYPFIFSDEPIINGALSLAKRGAENA